MVERSSRHAAGGGKERGVASDEELMLCIPYEQDDRLAGVAETPDPLIGPWAARDELRTALGQISADHREVLILRYVEDFALNDIASILHLPLGTVKTRLLRALRRMRALLEPCHAEEAAHA
jgi:RNA polymerase sigma factor (sigma-70 family)